MVHCCTSAVSILSRLRRHTFPDYMCLKSRLELLTVNRLQVLCMRSSNSKKRQEVSTSYPEIQQMGTSQRFICALVCAVGLNLNILSVLSIVLPHVDDDTTGPHLPSRVGIEALSFYSRPDVSPQLRYIRACL